MFSDVSANFPEKLNRLAVRTFQPGNADWQFLGCGFNDTIEGRAITLSPTQNRLLINAVDVFRAEADMPKAAIRSGRRCGGVQLEESPAGNGQHDDLSIAVLPAGVLTKSECVFIKCSALFNIWGVECYMMKFNHGAHHFKRAGYALGGSRGQSGRHYSRPGWSSRRREQIRASRTYTQLRQWRRQLQLSFRAA